MYGHASSAKSQCAGNTVTRGGVIVLSHGVTVLSYGVTVLSHGVTGLSQPHTLTGAGHLNLYGAYEVLTGKAVGTRLSPYGVAYGRVP